MDQRRHIVCRLTRKNEPYPAYLVRILFNENLFTGTLHSTKILKKENILMEFSYFFR